MTESLIGHYAELPHRVAQARATLGRPLTYAEKLLYSHLYRTATLRPFERGVDYVEFAPDRVAMQDATAQMALLQFMNAGQTRTAVATSVHCDHLIQAFQGAAADLAQAKVTNAEIYEFLRAACDKYGIEFWQPGAGIIHQVVLENYATPGAMLVGTDSHTPTAGGLGMLAIGVGGADAVDVMTEAGWELKLPQLIGVHLSGRLQGWTAAKDVILHLAGLLTVKGGTNSIIEYFGDGAESLSATGKATICNMGAEVGATTSLFGYDAEMATYLRATGRGAAASAADQIAECLRADPEVLLDPDAFFDRVIEINLDTLEPYLNGPFTPDAATPLSQFAARVREHGYPRTCEVGLIGSCTNSSYEDLSRAASIARQAKAQNLPIRAQLIINPGSEQIRRTAERDGLLTAFTDVGALIMANACGPCIGQWRRAGDDNERPNSIVTSFNRNFAKRADGNPNTHAFVASPEIAMAFTIAGDLCFNPITDTLPNADGQPVRLTPPIGDALPSAGFETDPDGCLPPTGTTTEISIDPNSDRLQRLAPFAPADDTDLKLRLLIKAQGKCTTDHISMAGPWLKFRGHLENISNNLLMGAVNAFNGQTNQVFNPTDGSYAQVAQVARAYQQAGLGSIIVAEDNYGEGSSREHAAMEPRYLGVRVVLVKSFARIHETNLKKQGMLALTFADPADYDLIREDDEFKVHTSHLRVGQPVKVEILHADGSRATISTQHSYNELQLAWFRAGSALNYQAAQRQEVSA